MLENIKFVNFQNVSGSIAIKDVDFSYPANPDRLVIEGLNIIVEPGKNIALVGPSGGGKSSIIALLERLYLPKNGNLVGFYFLTFQCFVKK